MVEWERHLTEEIALIECVALVRERDLTKQPTARQRYHRLKPDDILTFSHGLEVHDRAETMNHFLNPSASTPE
jgi:hypothetical protein